MSTMNGETYFHYDIYKLPQNEWPWKPQKTSKMQSWQQIGDNKCKRDT